MKACSTRRPTVLGLPLQQDFHERAKQMRLNVTSLFKENLRPLKVYKSLLKEKY